LQKKKGKVKKIQSHEKKFFQTRAIKKKKGASGGTLAGELAGVWGTGGEVKKFVIYEYKLLASLTKKRDRTGGGERKRP